MTALAIVLGSVALWLALCWPFAIVTGRTIKAADKPQPEPDLLADLPVDILSPAEVDRRFAEMTAGDRVWFL